MTTTDSGSGLLSPARVQRVQELIAEAVDILNDTIEEQITTQKRYAVAICCLFSGGNDSTVLTHLFRRVADYAVHINTGIGIDATRTFVRNTCAGWNLPLIEEHPPAGSTYEELVIDRGFPGPAHHWKMYTRLKERGLEAVRTKLVPLPFKQRVVYLAGRRRDESHRRAAVPTTGRKRSIVWCSPLVNWTALDMNTYRAMYDVPRNPVADLIHMSGECLCGAFAKKGELDEIGTWFPEVREHIEELQAKVAAAGHPPERCRWGWGAYRRSGAQVKPSKSGPLCSSCEFAFEGDSTELA